MILSPQVNCLTVAREGVTLWLPPGLPHSLAVRAVDDMLEVREEGLLAPFVPNCSFVRNIDISTNTLQLAAKAV
jgi:hypothetical protein